MTENKIKVNLGIIMKDGQGQDIITVPKTSVIIRGGRIIGIDNNSIKENKKYIFGYALCDLLSVKVKAKDLEDAAKIKRWHAKIYNECVKAKPYILLDKEELKEIKSIILTASPETLDILVDGTIFDIITDYIEIAIKK